MGRGGGAKGFGLSHISQLRRGRFSIEGGLKNVQVGQLHPQDGGGCGGGTKDEGRGEGTTNESWASEYGGGGS